MYPYRGLLDAVYWRVSAWLFALVRARSSASTVVPAVENLNASGGLFRRPVRARVLVVSSVDYGNMVEIVTSMKEIEG